MLEVEPDTGKAYVDYLAEGDFDGDGVDEVLSHDLEVGTLQPAGLILLEPGVLGSFEASGHAGPLGQVVTESPRGPWPTADIDGDGDVDAFGTELTQGQLRDGASGGSAQLSFHGGEVSLSVGGAEGCCDMRNTETGVLVRFGELQDSIVVDGVEYSLQGERISP